MAPEVTTVADDLVVVHDGPTVTRYEGLAPDTEHEVQPGLVVRTLPRPPGALLCRVATVNDVHFGEVECGRVGDSPDGPILRRAPGEPPYPEVMSRAAVAEIAALDPAAVIVKGDLTADGTPPELAAFAACYARFADRLTVVRGNHDAYRGQTAHAGDHVVDVPGLRIAVLDTAWPGHPNGRLDADQVAWLDGVAAGSDRPVLVLGHHHAWDPGSDVRSDDYFGLVPAASEALVEVVARRRAVIGYAAGHTHRNRRRTFAATGPVPWVEVACVKDFPGSWAEYRVFEGGVLQVHHRISAPEALAWSDRCRVLYSDFGLDYVAYALGRLEDRCFVLPTR